MFRGGIPELMRHARRIQGKLEAVREELKGRTETVSIAGGKVTVTASGERRIISVKIDPSMLEGDLAMLEDMITGAVNSALEKIDSIVKTETEKVTGGVSITGIF